MRGPSDHGRDGIPDELRKSRPTRVDPPLQPSGVGEDLPPLEHRRFDSTGGAQLDSVNHTRPANHQESRIVGRFRPRVVEKIDQGCLIGQCRTDLGRIRNRSGFVLAQVGAPRQQLPLEALALGDQASESGLAVGLRRRERELGIPSTAVAQRRGEIRRLGVVIGGAGPSAGGDGPLEPQDVGPSFFGVVARGQPAV